MFTSLLVSGLGLVSAVSAQAGLLCHTSNLYLNNHQVSLGAKLVELSFADKAFFCNSGAEANEAAIKLSRRHASDRGITKPVIITAEKCFHGRTLAALTAWRTPSQKLIGNSW